MKIGEISSREDGCFQWTIENFPTDWTSWCIFTSPTFIYNGLEYYVNLVKLSRGVINVSFNSVKLKPSNVIYVPFKFITDCNTESQSKFYVSKWNDEKKFFEQIILFDKYILKELWMPLHQHITILFWIKEQNGKSGKLSENANKPLNTDTKSECKCKSGKISENANKPLNKGTKSECESKSGKILENANKPLNKDTKSECESKSGKTSENGNKPLNKHTKSECESKSGKILENANKPLNKDTKSECESKSGKISENANKPLNKGRRSECENKNVKISKSTDKHLNEETNSECEYKSGNISESANKHLNKETKSECENFEEELKLCLTDPEKGDYVQLVQKKPLDASIQKFLSEIPSDEKNLILPA